MSSIQALLAFGLAAGLLTVTPGLDTALVLRTAATGCPRRAFAAAVGIGTGCMIWGLAAACGAGALLTASTLAYAVLQGAGAAYLLWLGIGLILRPRQAFEAGASVPAAGGLLEAFRRGLLTNLLNPKVGIFYISFLPQFVPTGAQPASFGALLAGLHVVMGLIWAGLLIAATVPLSGLLRRPAVVMALDRITGGVFIAFGLRLVLDRRD
jgi:threonine/homoserine/homoserine lactone efflux protein